MHCYCTAEDALVFCSKKPWYSSYREAKDSRVRDEETKNLHKTDSPRCAETTSWRRSSPMASRVILHTHIDSAVSIVLNVSCHHRKASVARPRFPIAAWPAFGLCRGAQPYDGAPARASIGYPIGALHDSDRDSAIHSDTCRRSLVKHHTPSSLLAPPNGATKGCKFVRSWIA